jgi:hypothetical protein
MTVLQMEYADANRYLDPSPANDARSRLEQLFRDLRGALITVAAKEKQLKKGDVRFDDYEDYILNRLGQAQLRAAMLNEEIDETILSAAEDIKAARAKAEVDRIVEARAAEIMEAKTI